VAAMRGGMDPSVQQQLDSIDFRQNIDWDETDRCLGRVRAGEVIAPPELTNYMRLAQLLAASTALQQWDPLAAFLDTLPPELRGGMITHISFTHFVRRQVFCVGVGRGLTGTMGFAGGVISPQRFRRIWLPRPKQCNGDSAPRTTPGISSVPPARSAFVGSSSSPTYPDASHVASASS
jgi:hypothetical protein